MGATVKTVLLEIYLKIILIPIKFTENKDGSYTFLSSMSAVSNHDLLMGYSDLASFTKQFLPFPERTGHTILVTKISKPSMKDE